MRRLRTLADGRAIATPILRPRRRESGRRLGVFGARCFAILQSPLRQTARLWRGRAMRRLHTLADGRAVATPILLSGMALESWGEKGALTDGQECPSYYRGAWHLSTGEETHTDRRF
jgi:hypothetical protein